MGTPDRLREDGKTEEEIAKIMAGNDAISLEQNPETVRVSHSIEPIVGKAYVPPPSGDGIEDEYIVSETVVRKRASTSKKSLKSKK